METIHTASQTGPDGILKLELPLGAANTRVEVTVTFESKMEPMSQEEWNRFIDATAGSINDPSFFRHDQGELTPRDPLL
jgi:formylglycine-generating enzyme required for sulfatase activity